MTENELNSYKILVFNAHKEYVVDLTNKMKLMSVNMKYEFDSKLWVLTKTVEIITNFMYTGDNYYDQDSMLQWQDIMNDIMKTKLYIDFKIE